jgi:hypothetical protein
MKLWYSSRYLVDWFNEAEHPEVTRFIEIVETTKKLATLAHAKKRDRDDPQHQRQVGKLEHRVNQLLATGRPAKLRLYGLDVWRSGRHGLQPPGEGSITFRWMPPGITKRPEWDVWNALEAVRKLSESGDIGRVRRCTQCQRWFFAHSNITKYCSDACKQKHKASTPEFQKHRREYMRNYYAKYQSPKRFGIKAQRKSKGEH